MLHKRRGLTLVELAVVLALLALLASIAVPSFSTLVARKRLASVAEQLAADLGEARFQAAQSGLPIYVVFRPGPSWCYAVARDSSCDCHAVGAACQLRVVRAADVAGVDLGAADDAAFDPAAVAASSGSAEWHSARAGHALRVSLLALGRAHICTRSGLPGYAAC